MIEEFESLSQLRSGYSFFFSLSFIYTDEKKIKFLVVSMHRLLSQSLPFVMVRVVVVWLSFLLFLFPLFSR